MQKRYNCLTKEQKKLAFEAIDFFVDRVMPRMKASLSVRVIGVPNLIDQEGVYGWCDYLDAESQRPREFEITVDNQSSKETFVSTILHEMVHVKQWARNEMRDISTYTRRWKDSKIQIDETDYLEHPWEVEAFEMEERLFTEFWSAKYETRSNG